MNGRGGDHRSAPGADAPLASVNVPGSQEPPLDVAAIAALREVADGDEAFVKDVLTAYLEQAAEIVVAMRASLSANDARSLKRSAHALAGSSLNAGAAVVARVSRTIEKSEDHAPAFFATALDALESELRRVTAAAAGEGWVATKE